MSDEDDRAEGALDRIVARGGTTVAIEQARATLRIARALERIADNSDQELRATAYTLSEEYGFQL